MMKAFFSPSLLLLLFAVANAADKYNLQDHLAEFRSRNHGAHEEMSPEKFAHHEAKRVEHVEILLQERRQSLSEHESGRSLLSDEERSRFQRQVINFERKLTQMKDTTHNDRKLKLEEMRTGFRDEQRLDYIDFEKAGIM